MSCQLPPPQTGSLPDPALCERARLSRDSRFDGLFFTAVRSTGIYCRPVCPAPAPRPGNVTYLASAAAAEAAGYRPCLRCRPELAPGPGGWRRGQSLLARALALIDDGALATVPLAALAARLAVGERHLRRLFQQQLGVSPGAVHATRRRLFAKQLLTETRLPVTQVALAVGFGSLRRFNDDFLQAYGMSPGRLRRQQACDDPQPGDDGLTLRLAFRPPFDFAASLEFLRQRALAGIERVSDDAYERAIGSPQAPASLRVSAWPGDPSALALHLQGVPAGKLQTTVRRVRRMFDLDAEPARIASVLSAEPALRPLLGQRPGLRLVSGWDGFEIAVRAVIGQQISVAAARTITGRLLARHGQPLPGDAPGGFSRLFPDAAALAAADLSGLGLTGRRIATVQAMATALAGDRLALSADAGLERFITDWTTLPGIGDWTANYIALRALAHPDAFPAGDLVLRQQLGGVDTVLSGTAARQQAETWRPWRGYAVIHLWRQAAASASGTMP